LAEENQALRKSQASLMSEKEALLEKNALARTRIEAMIARLKSMEVSA
jgi:cell division protein ZapB